MENNSYPSTFEVLTYTSARNTFPANDIVILAIMTPQLHSFPSLVKSREFRTLTAIR